MKSADSLSYNVIDRLADVNQIIDNGVHCFKKNMNNSELFWYRGGYYNLVQLKAELDSYGKEREMLNNLLKFYEEILS